MNSSRKTWITLTFVSPNDRTQYEINAPKMHSEVFRWHTIYAQINPLKKKQKVRDAKPDSVQIHRESNTHGFLKQQEKTVYLHFYCVNKTVVLLVFLRCCLVHLLGFFTAFFVWIIYERRSKKKVEKTRHRALAAWFFVIFILLQTYFRRSFASFQSTEFDRSIFIRFGRVFVFANFILTWFDSMGGGNDVSNILLVLLVLLGSIRWRRRVRKLRIAFSVIHKVESFAKKCTVFFFF